MFWLKKRKMDSVIYPAGLKIYFSQKRNKIVLLTTKILNGNVRSDAFYEDKLQTSNQEIFSIEMVLKKSTFVNKKC